jgi:hypothetical protein
MSCVLWLIEMTSIRQNGDGFRDNVKFWYNQTPAGRLGLALQGPRKHPTYRLQKVLDHTKGKKVTSLHVGRKPVISAVQKALDAISFGRFSKAKKKLGYEDVFHHFILAGLDDGSFHKLERNHVIEHKHATNDDFAQDLLDIHVPQGKDLTLDGMIEKAGGDNPDFWRYRADKNNCQYFTKDMVTKNGLAPHKPEGDAFLEPQDTTTLLGSIPQPLGWIPQAVTDLAGSADRATSMVANGLGKTKKIKPPTASTRFKR